MFNTETLMQNTNNATPEKVAVALNFTKIQKKMRLSGQRSLVKRIIEISKKKVHLRNYCNNDKYSKVIKH